MRLIRIDEIGLARSVGSTSGSLLLVLIEEWSPAGSYEIDGSSWSPSLAMAAVSCLMLSLKLPSVRKVFTLST